MGLISVLAPAAGYLLVFGNIFLNLVQSAFGGFVVLFDTGFAPHVYSRAKLKRVVHHFAVVHDHEHILKREDVAKRVLIDDDEVGFEPLLDRARAVFDTRELGGHARRCLDAIHSQRMTLTPSSRL